MKVIVLSIDRKVFEEGSSVRERMIRYGSLVDALYIVTHTPPGFVAAQIAPNVWIIPTNTRVKAFYWIDAYDLCAQIIGKQSGFLITVQDGLNNILGVFLKLRFHTKLQVQVHDDIFNPRFMWESWRAFIDHIGYWFGLRFADGIRVVSARAARSLTRFFRTKKMPPLSIVPVFIDTALLGRTSQGDNLHALYPQFSYIVLMVSRLEKEKNIQLGIDAFAHTHKDAPGGGLVIVGDGSLRGELEGYAREQGIGESCVFLGWRNDLAGLYASADIYMLTSDHEGYARTLVEAAFVGCPIVSTDVGIIGDVFKDGESALVAPTNDSAILASHLIHLAKDDMARRTLARAASSAVRAHLPISEAEYLVALKHSWEEAFHV